MTQEAAGGYLVGLAGAGIGPSLSPQLHEREAGELGLRYLYRRLDLDRLRRRPEAIGEIIAAARLAGYDGLNITHPCKQLALAPLDRLAPDAAALGAVNTVLFTDAGTLGHNTDQSGFTRALALGLPDAELEHTVVLGAGGAGAAVAHGMLALGAGRIDVVDLDVTRAEQLAVALRARFGVGRAHATGRGELAGALKGADGLVHATPTGMAAHPGIPVPTELLGPQLWVADVVYRPLETELVRVARQRGCRVLDGGRMAVFQAADAFALFTGVEPDAARMLRHFTTLTGVEGSQTHA